MRRGFVLLIVLWVIALLALIAANVATTGRAATRAAANIRLAAVLQSAADGAVYEAAFHLLNSGADGWEPDGVAHSLSGGISVQIVNESDFVNIATAPAPLLTGLFAALGEPPRRAALLAQSVVNTRATPGATSGTTSGTTSGAPLAGAPPPGSTRVAFRTVDDLGFVPGISPSLLAQLRPHLTVFSTDGPTSDSPDAVVRAAVLAARRAGGEQPLEAVAGSVRTVGVTVRAFGPQGATFIRYAVLRLNPADHVAPFAILVWQSLPATQVR